MFLPMLFMVISLLIIFYIYDTIQFKKEEPLPQVSSKEKIGIKGSFNLLLIFGVVCSVLLSGFWKPNIEFTIYHVHLELQNIIRDILLLLLAYGSWKFTIKEIREANEYTWFPIQEVAKLFAGIFITIIPAIAILKAGTSGALAGIINSVSSDSGPVNHMYFWLTGILSSFLDNAPTYLVFFNTAGGDPQVLMGELSQTLLGPNEERFTFAGTGDHIQPDYIYALSVSRGQLREKMDPGNWELHMSASVTASDAESDVIKFIDDSAATTNPTVNQGGRADS